MTYEELKTEAKKQGYSLVKQPVYIKMLKCPCGAKNSTRYYSSGLLQKYYYCCKCGLHGEKTAHTTKQAKLNWNKAVEKVKLQSENKGVENDSNKKE